MVMTTTNAYQHIKWAVMTEWMTDPFQYSELTKIQDFYWLRYEDLFDKAKMKESWVKAEQIKFIEENRDTMFAIKSTEWIETREWLNDSKEWKRIKDFYGLQLEDVRDIEKLIKVWLKESEIQFIKWDEFDLTPYYPKKEVKVVTPNPKKDEWDKWWNDTGAKKVNWDEKNKTNISTANTSWWTKWSKK